MSARPRGPAHSSRALELLLENGDAARARWLLEQRLRDDPDDHSLLAALSLAWFEDGRLEPSLHAAERAQAAAPGCGLVRWYRANVLDALGRREPARAIYRALAESEAEVLAEGSCGLGTSRTRAVVERAHLWLELDQLGAKRLPEPGLRLDSAPAKPPPLH